MDNYILIYNFSDPTAQQRFHQELENTFKENQQEQLQGLNYFAFPSRNQPEVEDKVRTILHNFGINSQDFVALYYTRPQQPDEINRVMLLGHDEFIENHVSNISKQGHEDQLIDLMNFDFLKARTES
ncbi:MAG: hypothetical protein ACNS62_20895 [Candidatus Cyclobacteriaceae bacterium M3_2C_046]